MRGNPSKKKQTYKSLFGQNGTVPLDDRFCCENIILSVLKRKRRGNTTGSAATITSAKEGAKRSLDAEETPGDAGLEAVRKMRKIAFGMQMKKKMASEFNIE